MIEYVPLEKCRIDERFMMRLDYSVDSLAENIRANGQLQPGMGYRNDDGVVMVYIGIRRFMAVRKLHELYGAPDTFYVSIVPRPDEASMWSQAISENEERQSLTMLDKLNVAGTVPVAVLAGAIDSHIIRKLIEIKKAIGHDGMVDWLHMERMAGGNLSLAQMEALVRHLPDRWSRDVGAFIVVRAHYTTGAALGDNLPRLVANYSLADAPEVAEYLVAHGVVKPGMKPATVKPAARDAGSFMKFVPVKQAQGSTTHERNCETQGPHALQPPKKAGDEEHEGDDERAQEVEDTEESLPVVLVDPNEKDGQIYTCACGRKVRLHVQRSRS
ncbi:MAG: ParB N-terminal domain-containing protein [Nitrososphaerota archaeon]|jgi:hypothetical protein|nr:ParB N-terminal domain-containing protein [Nitrososphaerota archaeon]